MAAPTPPTSTTPAGERDPGAPFAPGEIDPELIKLARARPRVGVITAAGLVFLCIAMLIKLAPDRRFAGSGTAPTAVQVSDILAHKVATEQLVGVTAEPLLAHAIRTTANKGSLGLRLVPARGSGDRLWLVVAGDGWQPPQTKAYVGRLRKFDDLPLADATRAHAEQHPRPVFASAAAVRAGFATGRIASVAGDTVAIRGGDAVALDVVDPSAATIAASFNDRLPDTAAWRAALERAGIAPSATGEPDTALGQVRFTVPASVATTTSRLERASLFAARVETITRHYQTTWDALRRSSPAGLDLGGTVVPDDQIDLIGLYVVRGVPGDAYAIVTGESPADYWYVMPITIALGAILLVFAWALVRAIRRDVIPARAA